MDSTEKTSSALKIRPLSKHLGAEVCGDLNEVVKNPGLMAQLRNAITEHLVLRWRLPQMDPSAFVSMAGQMAPLKGPDRKNTPETSVTGQPLLTIYSDILGADGKVVQGAPTPSQTWHCDGSHRDAINSYVFTWLRRTPRPAPRSGWMNMYKVYESLPQRLKDRIGQLSFINHSYPRGADVDLAASGPSRPLEERMKGALHPFVRRHAVTGKPCLMMYYRRDAIIPGMPESESFALMSELWDVVANSPHQWHEEDEQPGDLIIWDNRCTLHYREGWNFGEREFWYLSCQGEKSIPAFITETAAKAA